MRCNGRQAHAGRRQARIDYNGSILLIVAAQNNKPEGAEAAAAARGEPGRRATLAYRFDALAERVRQIPVVCQSGRLLVCSAGSLLCCRRCVRPAALLPSAHRLRCPLLRFVDVAAGGGGAHGANTPAMLLGLTPQWFLPRWLKPTEALLKAHRAAVI
jgi:hypothetical protein